MTELSNPEHSYSEAIAHLDEALAILNRPGEGLGYSWGLKRGQDGYFRLLRGGGLAITCGIYGTTSTILSGAPPRRARRQSDDRYTREFRTFR